jgi:tyrosyl-tRNA synthetase
MTAPPSDEQAVDAQIRVLTSGAVDVITEADLRRKLARGTPLRAKLGIDPTASDIHLGFAVVLRKLRQFQELGHVAVLIIGDFTAQVGDPSGKSATRPRLTKDEVEAHATTYVEQVRRILLPDRLEIRRNSEWLGAMGIEDVLRLSARTTVARMLERNDFAQRYRDGVPISVMEFLYPLLQGWDSVMVRADVELGGTDQLFNNLVGRTLQEQEGQEGQVVLTTPLLEGLDGHQKMSKSLGNYVGIAEPAAEQFGKLMSLPDTLMPRYFLLTTGWHPDRVEEVTAALAAGDLAAVEAKRLLARTVVDLYHGEGAGPEAEAAFDRVFRRHDAPPEMPEFVLAPDPGSDGTVRLAALLHDAGLVQSNREGARMITQGAVKRDGEPVTDPELTVAVGELDGAVLQVGKRKWVRIRVAGS